MRTIRLDHAHLVIDLQQRLRRPDSVRARLGSVVRSCVPESPQLNLQAL